MTFIPCKSLAIILLSMTGFLSGCTDPNVVIDQTKEISNRNWSYVNKIKYDVNITDADARYNLYLNLRVTGDYKYANLFTLVSQRGPDGKKSVVRYEFKLANPDGEWLGKGTGNIYNYQKLFLPQYKFPAKGIYHIEIEQNMRDNPLREVSDVGLRVEKIK
ncbi:gliding motility lipoprotein GldH [Mucilaginibacter ginkgonis]|uniref:Gliding motility lipoprotein GldH n=2 Tax=Mucilaginibacter ginkgonis TaxID=2682091 RepID=A0A6I4HYP6_9SPHI|nr:gliding motility lipoprotein GldH [Mucilaginibacter ginkgonis]